MMSSMDDLTTLPLNDDAVVSPQETEVIERFFPNSETSPSSDGSSNLTLIGYATLLFIALANPFVDNLLEKIPWFNGSHVSVIAVKTLIFVIILFILQQWFV